MKSFEENTHAFVVRVWLEPREIDGAPPEWRGVIEHVPSGERRYLRNLDDIAVFISSYARGAVGKFQNCRSLHQWIKRLILKREG
jgi:hypothetical protein